MRLGFQEILLVVAVIALIFGISRIVKLGKGQPTERETRPAPRPPARAAHPRLQLLGIIMLAGGAILLVISYELLKGIATGFIWATVIIALGLIVLVFASRRS